MTPPPVDAAVRAADLLSRDPPRVPDRDAERTRQFAEAVKQVGKEAGVPVVDCWTPIDEAAKRDEGGLGKYLSDGLHLNAEGYKLVTAGEKPAAQRKRSAKLTLPSLSRAQKWQKSSPSNCPSCTGIDSSRTSPSESIRVESSALTGRKLWC